MLIKTVADFIAAQKKRSQWEKGVKQYAIEILKDYADGFKADVMPPVDGLEKALLRGAKDWEQYSDGACSYVYDEDIISRLFPPSQCKRIPASANLLLVQARALRQAFWLIEEAYAKLSKEVD